MLSAIIFGAIGGIVVGAAGCNFSDQPVKTVVLLVILCLAHVFVQEI